MSDLSHVQASNRWVDILHPATRKKIGLKICLRPKYSKEVQSQLRKNRKKAWDAKRRSLDLDAAEEGGQKALISAIADWEWGLDDSGEQCTFRGEQPECTPANVEEVLETLPWVREQVDEAYGEDEAFFEA